MSFGTDKSGKLHLSRVLKPSFPQSQQQAKTWGARAGAGEPFCGRQYQISVAPGDHEAVFDIPVVQSGVKRLEALFHDPDGEVRGAYYVYIE